MQTTLMGRPTTMLEESQLLQGFESLILHVEYNTDTSAGHPVKDDDIVRYSLETKRVQDKELEQ